MIEACLESAGPWKLLDSRRAALHLAGLPEVAAFVQERTGDVGREFDALFERLGRADRVRSRHAALLFGVAEVARDWAQEARAVQCVADEFEGWVRRGWLAEAELLLDADEPRLVRLRAATVTLRTESAALTERLGKIQASWRGCVYAGRTEYMWFENSLSQLATSLAGQSAASASDLASTIPMLRTRVQTAERLHDAITVHAVLYEGVMRESYNAYPRGGAAAEARGASWAGLWGDVLGSEPSERQRRMPKVS